MKILYFDCFSGISGDMFLGAMVDLGVPADFLISQLKKLKLSGYELEIYTAQRKGISGTRVNVKLLQAPHDHDHHLTHDHHHDHSHTHEQHHDHEHLHQHTHDRNFNDIKELIHNSELSSFVKETSIKIFTEVAKAESKIHGKPIHLVQFHEVGAIDSIVDIVGAAICVEALPVDKIIFSSIAVGGGFINCAHGRFPVPAPATVEILKGIPIVSGQVEKELTTPTGAAITKVLADKVTDHKDFTIERIGYGVGHRDNAVPNVLRVFLGEIKNFDYIPLLNIEYCDHMIEANIDDCNPEIYPFVMDRLLAANAMDVWMTPIIMKKGRAAITLSVLCSHNKLDQLMQIIFTETTTIGMRTYPVYKHMLDRSQVTLETPYGEVNFKTVTQNGSLLKFKPEFEDCKRIALNYKIPLHQVYHTVNEIYRSNDL